MKKTNPRARALGQDPKFRDLSLMMTLAILVSRAQQSGKSNREATFWAKNQASGKRISPEAKRAAFVAGSMLSALHFGGYALKDPKGNDVWETQVMEKESDD